jgi:hypothetical protein
MRIDGELLWYPWLEPGAALAEASSRHRVQVELFAQGRMRFIVRAEGLHLAPGTELRGQLSRFGHVLVWEDKSAYRVLRRGSLRTFFQEYRGDVAPLLEGKQKVVASGGSPTPSETLSIETEMGTLVLEQTEALGLGGSTALLCRLLTELILAELDESVCRPDWLPVKADYRWSGGGRFGFVSRSMTRVSDLTNDDFSIPPDSAGLRAHDMPPVHKALHLDKAQLRALVPQGKAEPPDPETNPPKRGLIVTNGYGTPRYISVAGHTVAWLPPQKSLHIGALKNGSYELLGRDFLGIEAPFRRQVNAPGRTLMGQAPERPAAPR